MSQRPEPSRDDPNAGYKRAAKMLGIASGLGLEMAVLVAGAAFLGEALQKRFELGTWVTLVCVGVAGVTFAWHMRYLLKTKSPRANELS